MEVYLSVRCGDLHDFNEFPVVLPPLAALEPTQPDLRIGAPPGVTIHAGGLAHVPLQLKPLSGFHGPVQRGITGLPPMVSLADQDRDRYPVQETSEVQHTGLSLTAAIHAAQGRYPLRLSFCQNDWHREVALELLVAPAPPLYPCRCLNVRSSITSLSATRCLAKPLRCG